MILPENVDVETRLESISLLRPPGSTLRFGCIVLGGIVYPGGRG